MAQVDKATEGYWSELWRRTAAEQESGGPVATYLNSLLHHFFIEHLRQVRPGSSLIEVGCGNSAWLPYFAQYHGCRVAGIDYSESGCESARAILKRERVEGVVYCSDVFAPPAYVLGQFDVVVSMGLVEHFAETVAIVQAVASLARPGGLVLTTIPNLAGWLGAVQRRLDRDVYDKHVALSREDVRSAHEEAGLSVLQCTYVATLDFHVCNLNATDLESAAGRSRRLALKGLMKFSRLLWEAERHLGPITPTRSTATQVVCAARVPA